MPVALDSAATLELVKCFGLGQAALRNIVLVAGLT